jgi:hypothetical protein
MNLIAHKQYDPSLESLKSRLLLEGLYRPNIECKESDLVRPAIEFLKENKNHKCENFTISDIYDAVMKEQKKKKHEKQEAKLQALL